jgi:protein-tyrosine phosphatase/arsenate reductase
MLIRLKSYCDDLVKQFERINPERKLLLESLATYIRGKVLQHKPVNLIYICTHNSRRSHFGQIWASVASHYYGIDQVNSFSGGTEATAFNINAINALKRVGFKVDEMVPGKNPHYELVFSKDKQEIVCFSKVYDDANNPQKEFAAIMTCSDAEQNCPFIPGAELRISTTYDDPKVFDNTEFQDSNYDERCEQIALETLYVFYKVKQ